MKKFSYSLTHTNFPGLVSGSRSGDPPTLSICKTGRVKPVIKALIRRQKRLYHRSWSPTKSPQQLLYILPSLALKFKKNCPSSGPANYKRTVLFAVTGRRLCQSSIIGRFDGVYHQNTTINDRDLIRKQAEHTTKTFHPLKLTIAQPGDWTGDGIVNFFDFAVIADN